MYFPTLNVFIKDFFVHSSLFSKRKQVTNGKEENEAGLFTLNYEQKILNTPI